MATNTGPAKWPPSDFDAVAWPAPEIPGESRAYPYIMEALPGSIYKAGGKRQWREVGTRGTFIDAPLAVRIELLEAAYFATLRSIANKGARLPMLRVGVGVVPRERIASFAARLARGGASEREMIRIIVGEIRRTDETPLTDREVRKARAHLRKTGHWPTK